MFITPNDGLVMLTITFLGMALGLLLFDQLGPWSTAWSAWVADSFGSGAKADFLNRLPTYMAIAQIALVLCMAFPWVVRR